MNLTLPTSARELAHAVRTRLGPLGWGTLVVFSIHRIGDVSNITSRFFLGRYLSAVDFGAIEPVLGVIRVLGLPMAVLMSVCVKSISRLQARGEYAKCRALLADMMKLSVVASLVGVVAIVALRGYILERLHLDNRYYTALIAGLLVLSLWQPLYRSIVQGRRQYRSLLFPSAGTSLLMLLLTLLLVGGFGWGLPGALAARVCAGLIITTTVFVMLRSALTGEREPYRDELRVMGSMLVPVALMSLSGALLTNYDRLFVRNFLLEDSGGYGAILVLGAIPGYFLHPLTFVLFPLAAAEHAGGGDARRFMKQSLLVGTIVTVVCALGFLVLAEPVMRVWNAAFVPYAPYVAVYGLAEGVQAMTGVVTSVEIARHRYGFLWFMIPASTAMCAVLYLLRSTITLGGVLWIMVAVRTLVLLVVGTYGFKRVQVESPARVG